MSAAPRELDIALAVRETVTPEGVPLRFGIARAGDRLAALVLDALLIGFLLIVLFLAALLLARMAGGAAPGGVAALLGFFLVRNFYFTWFEARRGATPGKRRMRLAVIDHRGGPLTTEAVLARNFMREIEIFLPLTALPAAESLFPGAPGWLAAAGLLWIVAIVLVPLSNRDRQRVGDLVAGTIVVSVPVPQLLPDLAAAPRGGVPAASAYAFAREHLEHYGIRELELLEQVLRDRQPKAMAVVADKIIAKTGWRAAPGARVAPERFLRAFYAAQRAHLEQRLLLGERRERKREAPPSR